MFLLVVDDISFHLKLMKRILKQVLKKEEHVFFEEKELDNNLNFDSKMINVVFLVVQKNLLNFYQKIKKIYLQYF